MPLALFTVLSSWPNASDKNYLSDDTSRFATFTDTSQQISHLFVGELPWFSEFSFQDPQVYDNALWYYFFAKDKRGEQLLLQKCQKVDQLLPLIYMYADSFAVPRNYFLGLNLLEWWWDPQALSSAGAKWLTQFMKGTAKMYGGYYKDPKTGKIVDKRSQVHWSLWAWSKHLRDLYRDFGDRSLAFAAYHMGTGNMNRLRGLYKTTMGSDLCSIDQLYKDVPSPEVIAFFAWLDDDSFGYYAKIRNACTIFWFYKNDKEQFLRIHDYFATLDYDLRGIVMEKVMFDSSSYFAHQDAILDAILANDLVALDHTWFACARGWLENFLHKDAASCLSTIQSLYGKNVLVACGLLDMSGTNNAPQDIRLASHATGRVFDIQAPTHISDRQKLEYILTLLRYRKDIVRCREKTSDSGLQYHIVVL